jgi:hypothetical protein
MYHQWQLCLAVLLALDGPTCEKTSEAVFLERILPSFHRNTLRRWSWVKTGAAPQYTETFNLVFSMKATEPPSTAWQAGHSARAWLCWLTLIELR